MREVPLYQAVEGVLFRLEHPSHPVRASAVDALSLVARSPSSLSRARALYLSLSLSLSLSHDALSLSLSLSLSVDALSIVAGSPPSAVIVPTPYTPNPKEGRAGISSHAGRRCAQFSI